jgi:hypothetical protein
MELDTVFLIIRVICHFGIAIRIGAYQPHGARQRWGVSCLATALACSNAGLGTALLTGAIDPKTFGPQFLYVVAFGAIFALVMISKGNVAKLFPRSKHA